MADLKELPQSNVDLRHKLILMVLPSHLPFHDPNQAEEQIGYGNQKIRERQIVSGVWKADFVGSVVAVKKIGLLQEALQSKD